MLQLPFDGDLRARARQRSCHTRMLFGLGHAFANFAAYLYPNL